MKNKFYITTAIDYVNASPHLGHALEKIQADVIARYQRIKGKDVFFLTGTDENSLKNVRVAKDLGILTQDLVNKNAAKFYQLKEALNLSFDDFIRTTQERHKKGVQKFWLAIKKDIYKKKYRGLYCVGCEEFYKEEELENGLCPEHKIKPEIVEEENYFFALSKYQAILKRIIGEEKIEIIPEEKKIEVLSFIEKGLEDICISRSRERAHGWGIEVPGDKTQIVWVWLDALSNYITAIDYGEDGEKFKKYWPADLHLIGKGISRFHCIYWPAFLISAKLSLPKLILVHGYITVDGQKMSKSLGNVIDPFSIVKKYGTDALRYFLLRESSPFEDLDFTFEKFEKRYNDDLAKGLGNLVARVISLAEKSKISKIREIKSTAFKEKLKITQKKWEENLENFQFNEALKTIWELISFCDKFIEVKKPWKKNGAKIVSELLFILEEISNFLRPFLPETAERISKQIITTKKEILFPHILK
jgi:methionyl-tRNA synthetase